MEIEVGKIKTDKDQPRKTFSNLEGLARTIRKKGIINPIVVDRDFRIICGERRYRAAKIAGLGKIPVLVKDISDLERLELQLIEDIHDNLLSPIERADAWLKLKEKKGLSNAQLSKVLGVSERYVYKVLRLANLPKEMAFAFENKQITIKELLKVRSLPEDEQLSALKQITTGYEKPKLRYMPRDFLRKKGASIARVLPSSRGESWKHFLVKCAIFKILKDKKRYANCEVEVEGAIADVIDLTNRNVYEVETCVSPERVKKKLADFRSFNDVFIIKVPDVPDDILEMEKYLKERVI